MTGHFTSKIGAIGQLHSQSSFGEDIDHAVLDEVHLFANGAFADDVIPGLEDLEAELS